MAAHCRTVPSRRLRWCSLNLVDSATSPKWTLEPETSWDDRNTPYHQRPENPYTRNFLLVHCTHLKNDHTLPATPRTTSPYHFHHLPTYLTTLHSPTKSRIYLLQVKRLDEPSTYHIDLPQLTNYFSFPHFNIFLSMHCPRYPTSERLSVCSIFFFSFSCILSLSHHGTITGGGVILLDSRTGVLW